MMFYPYVFRLCAVVVDVFDIILCSFMTIFFYLKTGIDPLDIKEKVLHMCCCLSCRQSTDALYSLRLNIVARQWTLITDFSVYAQLYLLYVLHCSWFYCSQYPECNHSEFLIEN